MKIEKMVLSLTGMIVILGGFNSAVSGAPQVVVPVSVSPKVVLTAYGLGRVVQDKHEPLLLQVAITNPAGIRAQAKNVYAARLQKVLRDSGDLTKLSQQSRDVLKGCAQLQVVPTAALSFEQQPIADAISFTVKSAKEPVSIRVRKLKSSLASPPMQTLSGTDSVILSYGIDAADLGKLPDGSYDISAQLSNGKKLPTATDTTSNVLRVALTDKVSGLSDLTRLNLQYQYGAFYMRDKQYDMVQQCAQRMEAIDPLSIGAAELQGDVAFAQGNLDQAVQSYRTALDRSEAKFGAGAGAKLSAGEIFVEPRNLYARLEQVAATVAEKQPKQISNAADKP